MRLDQVDLLARCVSVLEDAVNGNVDKAAAASLADDLECEIAAYWDNIEPIEPTDTDIYRMRGGVLRGEVDR